jgi:hypothetical protein
MSQKPPSHKPSRKISRRHFVERTGAGLAAAATVAPLKGQQQAAASQAAIAGVGEASVDGARPLAKNGYKIPLTGTIVNQTVVAVASA